MQFKKCREWNLLSAEQQQTLHNNMYLTRLKASVASEGKMLEEWMVMRNDVNYNKWTMECNIKPIVPRPPHFGKIKYYKGGKLMRRWSYKYSELWFIQTGEKLIEFDKKGDEDDSWNIVLERVFKKKWNYLKYLRKKELEKERNRNKNE